MSDEIPSVRDIINLLPDRLRLRFASLGKFVNATIEEEVNKSGSSIKLTKEDRQLIQLAVLLYSLDDFFRTGSRSARNAASTFEDLNLQGFSVGNQYFTRDNHNTRRGDELADRLNLILSTSPLGKYISKAPSMSDLISTLIYDLKDD